MSFSLDFDDGQRAIHDALSSFCEAHADDAVGRIAWSRALWSELGELGIFGPCSAGGEGGALEIASAMEALGQAGCPGPFAATYFATQALADDADAVDRIADGRWLTALGEGGLFGFGAEADVWIELAGPHAVRGRPAGAPEHVTCLGGDPAARLALSEAADLPRLDRAFALADVANAARIAGCARRLVALASAHARTRKQFRKPIGDFQAVAHPLADAHMHAEAASTLARVAAFDFDRGDAGARQAAAKARLSASAAALETIHVVHQVFGAVGITLEGPIYHMTRRLRQWVAEPPSPGVARDVVLAGLGWSPDARTSPTDTSA
jgi:alkylation response protein AidB-like acyl-CoA dehydrogenase